MAKKIPERNELAEADKWALEDLYPTNEAWQQDLETMKSLSDEMSGYAGQLSRADKLLEYLRLTEKTGVYLEKIVNYAQRRSDQDTRDSYYQGLVGQMTKAWVALGEKTSFEVPELIEISDEQMERLYREQPELELYRRHLDNIRRRRAHILSKSEEKLLAAAGEMAQSPEQIYSMFDNADLKFQPAADKDGELHPVTQGTYISCMESPDRVLRKNAFESYYASYDSFRNTVAGTLSSQVKQLEFFANARHYDTALDASLDATNVPTSVYHNLIEAVHQNMDKMYRYVRLRRKLMGVDELHMYDIYTPLVSDVDVHIPFDEAKKTVETALAPMGEDYLRILREGFQNRWIDVYENVGKRSGAYSAGTSVHPFVLLNYTGTLDSQFTLAHEMGHAIHSYLSTRTQPVIYRDYVIFVAEVASTCNEALLMEHLLSKTTDKRQRAYLINHFLEQFKSTLYRQTMFAEFELRMAELNRQGTSLTADVLCQEYRKLNELYFGPDIVLDKQLELEWARIPHFYYNYYVFQYATGYSAAIALSRRILKEGKPAVDRYLGFLSGGCSKSPIELLQGAGVDMTTPAPVNEALGLFGQLLDEMEELMQ
jgi:oligoendopeptidase F